MKKVSKVLILLSLMIMLVFAGTISVNAAETIDYSGYKEVEEEVPTTNSTNTNKNTQNSNTQNTNKQSTNTQNKADTATTSHPKTGVYNNTVCISIVAVTAIAIVIAYAKMKKYNY